MLKMKIEFIIWFSICFICFLIRTIYNILNNRKNPIVQNKNITIVISIIMGVFWFSWFQMCFSDLIKINFPIWIRYFGLLLFIIGVLLFILSHLKLKTTSDRNFVKNGIYSKIRNPMYLGFIIWIIGFPIFMKSVITLLSSVIWITFIVQWKITEEKELEKKYRNYREYKNKTWF